MLTELPTIWINVTTSRHWNRPPVGIVRVEQALARDLSEIYGNRLRKCIWDEGKFIPIDDDKFEKLSQSSVVESGQSSNLPFMFSVLPRKQAIRSITQAIFSLSPGRIRPFVNRLFYICRWRISKFSNWAPVLNLRIRIGQGRKSSRPQNPNFSKNEYLDTQIFNPGDVLVSVGLDWDSPCFESFYFLRKHKQIKVVTCCYDLIPVFYPQYCVGEVANKFTSYFLDVVDGSDLVLCISKQSESDLLKLLDSTGAAIPKTHVFTLGDNVPQGSGNVLSKRIQEIADNPFLLYVSTIERRKNHEVLYRAYHKLAKDFPTESLPKLVFVGMQGWGVADLMNDIELDPLTRDLIVQLNHVSDEELAYLYEHAKFCLYPSLYEGWGLPVSEALSMGKFVLSSDKGSLTEVGKDFVQYVDPWDVPEWAKQIRHYLQDPQSLESQEAKVKDSYSPYSWKNSALSVAEAIDSIE